MMYDVIGIVVAYGITGYDQLLGMDGAYVTCYKNDSGNDWL